jgi:hypothetical protein
MNAAARGGSLRFLKLEILGFISLILLKKVGGKTDPELGL